MLCSGKSLSAHSFSLASAKKNVFFVISSRCVGNTGSDIALDILKVEDIGAAIIYSYYHLN